MNIKITIRLLRSLQLLATGQSVAGSRIDEAPRHALLEVGALTPVVRGSRLSYRATALSSFRAAVAVALGVSDIEAMLALLQAEGATRADATRVTGNSKARPLRTFFGFLVNSYEPLAAELSGEMLTIAPPRGAYLFVADYTTLQIAPDVVVVGIENAENFRCIRQQRALFERELPGRRLLFVSRYPQSTDLVTWLSQIPNAYVHFGDLDLCGVHIYLSEFYAKLGARASLLIPTDYRDRLALGSAERYDIQLARFPLREVADVRVLPLVDAIHAAHKGYDQEGYIDVEA